MAQDMTTMQWYVEEERTHCGDISSPEVDVPHCDYAEEQEVGSHCVRCFTCQAPFYVCRYDMCSTLADSTVTPERHHLKRPLDVHLYFRGTAIAEEMEAATRVGKTTPVYEFVLYKI